MLEAMKVWRRRQAQGQDLRDCMLACPDATLAAISSRFGVSKSSVSKTRTRLRDSGAATPGPRHNHVPLRLEPLKDALREQAAAVPDAKPGELRACLHSTHSVSVSHVG